MTHPDKLVMDKTASEAARLFDQGLTRAEIARKMRLSTPSIGAAIKRAQEAGWVMPDHMDGNQARIAQRRRMDDYILKHWQQQSDKEMAEAFGVEWLAVKRARLSMRLRRQQITHNDGIAQTNPTTRKERAVAGEAEHVRRWCREMVAYHKRHGAFPDVVTRR